MQIEALIERLEGLQRPDRDCDWRIEKAIVRSEAFPEIEMWPPFSPGCKFDKSIPRYTASLDAAIALVEKVLPGRNRTVRKRYRTTEGRIDGHIYDVHISGGDVCEGETEPIALLIAMLRALAAGGSDA